MTSLKQEPDIEECLTTEIYDDSLTAMLTKIQRVKLKAISESSKSGCLIGCSLRLRTDKGICTLDQFGRTTWETLYPAE